MYNSREVDLEFIPSSCHQGIEQSINKSTEPLSNLESISIFLFRGNNNPAKSRRSRTPSMTSIQMSDQCEFSDKKKGTSYQPSIETGGCEPLSKGDEDDEILRANGHEAAMPRQFTWISALGLAFSIVNSWIGYLVSFITVHFHILNSQC